MGTSYVENLLSKIDDESLRIQLTNEFNKLRDNKEFGLVFERHIPEYVRLYKREILEGTLVQLRSSKGDDIFIVREINGEKAKIENKDGAITEVDSNEFVVVSKHGDTIYPSLVEIERIERAVDEPFHVVINAENYQALQLLSFTHRDFFDFVVIDPPYNTGNGDWKYNNKFVEETDRYMGSKWLSFMEKRLLLTRNVMKEESVLVVTIDEHEINTLGMLLKKCFPDAEITLVTMVINPKGVGSRRFSRVEEYAYYCFFGEGAEIKRIKDDLLTFGADLLDLDDWDDEKEPRWNGLLRSGSNSRRQDRKNMFYPIYVNTETKQIVSIGESLLPVTKKPDFKTVKGIKPVWPIRTDKTLGNWGIGVKKCRELFEMGFLKIGAYDSKRDTYAFSYVSKESREQLASGLIYIESREEETNVARLLYSDPLGEAGRVKTVWHRTRHDAGVGGSSLIKEYCGKKTFDFPKSVYLINDIIEILSSGKKDAKILDYFAGSGTTCHATMMANENDGGKRVSYIITNNELSKDDTERLVKQNILPGQQEFESHGIFYQTTHPRIVGALTGTTPNGKLKKSWKNRSGSLMNTGYDENVVFTELTFLEEEDLIRNSNFEDFSMLPWLISGGVGPIVKSNNENFAIHSGGLYAVLFNTDYWQEFVDDVKQRDTITHAFIITDSKVQYQQVVKHLPTNIETTMLYEDYLRNFQIGV